MRFLVALALAFYLLTLVAAWYGCQADRGRNCQALHTLTSGLYP